VSAGEESLTQRDVEALRTTLDKLDRTVSNLPDRIEQTYVRKDVYERDQAALSATVENHSSWLEWAQRIVIAAVILALLGLVLAQSGGAL
jgi:hypothetical protein